MGGVKSGRGYSKASRSEQCRQCSILQISATLVALAVVYTCQDTANWEFSFGTYRQNAFQVFLKRKLGVDTYSSEALVGTEVQGGTDGKLRAIQRLLSYKKHCRGIFLANHRYKPAPLKDGTPQPATAPQPPALMLREAVVDMRHNSLAQHRLLHRGDVNHRFRRVSLHISATRGSKPVLPEPSPGAPSQQLEGPRATLTKANGWVATLDYILQDPPCINRCFEVPNKKGLCSGHEWQAIITLWAPKHVKTDNEMETLLESLSERPDIRLEVHIPIFLPHESSPTGSVLSLTLGCITGLTRSTSLSPLLVHMPPRPDSCSETSGSVLVAGGAMFGKKRNTLWHRKEAGHFAARGLLGALQFDTVAIGVIAEHSVSEIQAACGPSNDTCFKAFHDRNERFMGDFAATLEDELSRLEVPRALWERVFLFPMCNLGTDHAGLEANREGCKWSAFYGQWLSNDVSYALFSPYHRWYASFDLDEFIGREREFLTSTRRPRSIQPEKAGLKFAELDREKENGYLIVPWLDFKMPAAKRLNVTTDFIRNGGLSMRSISDGGSAGLNRSQCVQKGRVGSGGKAVVSCGNGGIGVHVHLPMRMKDASNLDSRECSGRGWTFGSELALYHGRSGPRFGDCQYAPAFT